MAVIGTDPYTVVQSATTATAQAGGAGATNTATVSLTSPVAAAGRLLRGSIAIDKSAGGFTTPEGWTLIPGTDAISSGVSMASYYKISTEGETPSITYNWTTVNGSRASIWETNLDAATLQGTPTNTYAITATVTHTMSEALTDPAYVEAVICLDTINTKWTAEGPTWSDGFVNVHSSNDLAQTGLPHTGGVALSIAARSYTTAGETPTTTATATSGDDQILTLIAWSNTSGGGGETVGEGEFILLGGQLIKIADTVFVTSP